MLPGESIPDRNQRLFEISDPVAMVTGSGADRVGRRIAEHLLAQGFRLVFHSHQPSADADEFVNGVRKSGRECMLVWGSVEDEPQVVKWREQIVHSYQRIDLLVNSAAIWDPKPLEATTAADFKKYFEVNTLGAALSCKHMGLQMSEQASGGAIVNIGDWAIRRPYRDFAAYFSSKGALETLTHSMAVELATRNPRVRVNAVLPGPVKLADNISEERRDQIVAECLLQREGTADDVAWAVLFLATSPFVSGVCLPVDGGRTIYAGPSADPVAHPGSS